MVNENFFDEKSPEMYYVLGAAYSCYRPFFRTGKPEKGRVIMKFTSNHETLLDVVKRLMGLEVKKQHDPRIHESTNGKKNSHWLAFTNPTLQASLENRISGFQEPEGRYDNFRRHYRFPEMDERYLPHFIRGFIEAQANVFDYQDGLTLVDISFNNEFLMELHKHLVKYAGVKRSAPKGDHLVYHHEDSIKIYRYIYGDWEYLKKHRIYLPSVKNTFNIRRKDGHQIRSEKAQKRVQQRMERAKKLLLKHNTVKVSKMVGYGHTSTFYHTFSEYMDGMTAGEYQRLARAKQI